jgi:hypothetical protein
MAVYISRGAISLGWATHGERCLHETLTVVMCTVDPATLAVGRCAETNYLNDYGGGMSEGVSAQGGGTEERRSLVSYYQERVARDAVLAVRVRAGDSDALTELYRIYWGEFVSRGRLHGWR